MPLVTHPKYVLFFILMVPFWTALHCVDLASADENDSIRETIKMAWNSRGTNTQTLFCAYRDEHTEIEYPGWGVTVPDGTVFPRFPRVHRTVEHEVKIDGEKFLHISNWATAKDSKNKSVSSGMSFDGNVGRRFATGVDKENWAARVTNHPASEMFNHSVNFPFFLAYRALHPRMSAFDLVGTDISSGTYDDIECVILKSTKKQSTSELWVGKGPDFLPVRYVSYVNKTKNIVIEMKYKNVSNVSLLSEWSIDVWNKNGTLETSSHCSVSSIETNMVIPKEVFVLKFPDVAEIYDLDSDDMRLLKMTE